VWSDNAGTAHLCARDTEEADAHHHTSDRDLVVTELDTIEILHTEGVCCDESVQAENEEHLRRSYKCTPPLTNDVGN
jgi:hypothetical protein